MEDNRSNVVGNIRNSGVAENFQNDPSSMCQTLVSSLASEFCQTYLALPTDHFCPGLVDHLLIVATMKAQQ